MILLFKEITARGYDKVSPREDFIDAFGAFTRFFTSPLVTIVAELGHPRAMRDKRWCGAHRARALSLFTCTVLLFTRGVDRPSCCDDYAPDSSV